MKRLATALSLVLCLCAASNARAGGPVRVGIVPQQAAAQLAKAWIPLLAYLSEKTGLTLTFETAKDIPTFEQRLGAGEYDIAYMNPFHYVVVHARRGYEAFAREKDRKLKGLVVVRADSPITGLADLAGKQVAFPAPLSFAATILPLAHLRSLGVEVTPVYTSSHDSVYLAVAKGIFPAGGGIARTLENMAPEVKSELRVLWSTPGYTPHPFAARPDFPKADLEKLEQALVSLNADGQGRELLAALGFQGVTKAADADYDDVRSLGIQLIEDIGRKSAEAR